MAVMLIDIIQLDFFILQAPFDFLAAFLSWILVIYLILLRFVVGVKSFIDLLQSGGTAGWMP
ncbi:MULTISPECIES: hypothetical protein [unclassified Pseudomonas]|uniref:hypothetical protein n=1 Tax=unclassified Pseudomonas TaxID=196821 RepID=UPI0030DA33AA